MVGVRLPMTGIARRLCTVKPIANSYGFLPIFHPFSPRQRALCSLPSTDQPRNCNLFATALPSPRMEYKTRKTQPHEEEHPLQPYGDRRSRCDDYRSQTLEPSSRTPKSSTPRFRKINSSAARSAEVPEGASSFPDAPLGHFYHSLTPFQSIE